jgi:hypothetical protein
MGINTSAIDRRTRRAMQHLGQSLTFGTTDFPCFPVAMRDSALRNRDQTFRAEYDTSVSIIGADVTIVGGDTVTFDGATKRVLDTQKTPDGLQTILHLGKQYGNAVRDV